MVQLYINGILADLLAQDYTYTLQVNDLFSFDTREFSHSGMFYLPTTPNNRKIFGFADEVASDNAGAYKKYSVDYYVNGIAITLEANGFLMGKRQGNFLFHFQENSKDIYQFLANGTLQGLPLEELTHNKTALVIKHQHENELDNLLYAVAHYGGKTQEGDRFNFDYVPASIRMDWIRKMIEQESGQKIQGNFFASQAWQRLYMTTSEVQKVSQENYYRTLSKYSRPEVMVKNFLFFFDIKNPPSDFEYIPMDIDNRTSTKLKVKEKGIYRVRMKCPAGAFATLAIREREHMLNAIRYGIKLYLMKNNTAYLVKHYATYNRNNNGEGEVFETDAVDFSIDIECQEGDELYFKLDKAYNIWQNEFAGIVLRLDEYEVSIAKKRDNTIEIKDYIAEFSLLDWFKEVLNFFSLTSIKDKNGQRFYTLDERLQAPAVDWSEKFVRIVEQKYHDTSSYGQINNYLYSKYDPQKTGQRDNDYRMLLQDEALPIGKEYQSKFFGALDNKTHLLGQEMETFGFWEEQAKQDNKGEIKIEYKEKNNRYHLFEAVQKMHELAFVSGQESGALSSCYVADFTPMKWENLHRKYYQNLPKLIGNLLCLTCEFSLNEVDIHQFSFFSRIYVEALGAYFLPNKITYKVGSLAVVEMVKIRQ